MLAAIGFPLVVIGFVMLRFFGATGLQAALGRTTVSDKIGGVMLILGILLLLASFVVWLARVAP